MIKNYIKTAWRNLLRNKTYSLINVLSITIGIAAFWMIALYVADEFSFDRNIPNADRIYRIAQHASWDGGKLDLPLTSPPLSPAMKAAFPEIEASTRIDIEGGGIITYRDKKLKTNDIVFADNNLFKVFQYDFISGDANTGLDKPNSIVITERLAKKIFADANAALNKTIYFGNDNGNLVTGVIKDLPENSSLQFSGVRSVSSEFNTNEWQNLYLYSYVKLVKGASIEALEKKLPKFEDGTVKKNWNVTNYKMELQPLTSIHLHSNLDYEIGTPGSISRVYMFKNRNYRANNAFMEY